MRRIKLTEELRKLLKQPLGILIRGSPSETVEKLREMIARERPRMVVAVGDSVTRSMVKCGIAVDLYIIDYKVMRAPIEFYELDVAVSVHVENPAGGITKEAWNKIKELTCQTSPSPAKLVVDGEEDLLALPAIIHAPIGSFVVYGQPGTGIVVVKVTDEKKREVREIVSKMQKI